MSEFAVGRDEMGIRVRTDFLERGNWKCDWKCEKWDQDQVEYAEKKHVSGLTLMQKSIHRVKKAPISSAVLRKIIAPEVEEREGNLLLNEGIQLMLDLLIGAGGTTYANATAQMGVGDSNAAEAATQLDLQAASNKLFVGMNATYPSRAAQTLTFQSDFTTAQANYAWQEASIRNSSGADKNLNRKVVSLGTKASGTWTLTGTVTIT